jgi:predicted transcriptional regulator
MCPTDHSIESTPKILDEYLIDDPEKVLIVLHETNRQLLEHLTQAAMTIQDLRNETNINPGTIKRQLDILENAKLVFIESIKENDYHIKMKYYRAIAKQFLIHFQIPKKN